MGLTIEIDEVYGICKTSADWYDEYPLEIKDPCGWDKDNFQFAWYEELLTFEEFDKRAMNSVVRRHGKI